MPALNFQKRFSHLVETGQKNQTIRPLRKDGRNPHEGDRLYLYTGMRTKYCRKLGEGICTGVSQCVLEDDRRIIVAANELDICESLQFALDEGFQNLDDMWDFFNDKYSHRMPFHGLLIRWQNCKTFECCLCRGKSDDPEDYTYSISEIANPWEPNDEFQICKECDMDGRDEKYRCWE